MSSPLRIYFMSSQSCDLPESLARKFGSHEISLDSNQTLPWGEGTATRRVEFLYQRHLEVGDQVTGHMWLIDSTFQ